MTDNPYVCSGAYFPTKSIRFGLKASGPPRLSLLCMITIRLSCLCSLDCLHILLQLGSIEDFFYWMVEGDLILSPSALCTSRRTIVTHFGYGTKITLHSFMHSMSAHRPGLHSISNCEWRTNRHYDFLVVYALVHTLRHWVPLLYHGDLGCLWDSPRHPTIPCFPLARHSWDLFLISNTCYEHAYLQT